MKVIFIKDLEDKTKRGDLKEVKSGYARNFLLPHGFVLLASDPRGKQLLHQIEEQKEKKEEELNKWRDRIASLGEITLKFKAKVNTKKQLFSSITGAMIKKEFEKQTKIENSKVLLEEPIKEIGEHSIALLLPHDLEIHIKIDIKAEK